MLVNGTPYRSIWRDPEGAVVIIDQRWLPHKFEEVTLATSRSPLSPSATCLCAARR